MNAVAEISNTRTRKEWAEVINADWRKSIESIIQTGRDLIAAKADLPDGQFGRMIADDLLFKHNMANKLMRIARHPSITDCSASNKLPSSWTVLAELVTLSASDFSDAKAKGLIGSDTTARFARAVSDTYNDVSPIKKKDQSKATLPTPSEAKKIARATSKLVAASDGHMYSGASDEDRQSYLEERTRTFRTIESVEFLAGMDVSPEEWREATQVEPHWLVDFNKDDIGPAILWLEGLRLIMDATDEKQKTQTSH